MAISIDEEMRLFVNEAKRLVSKSFFKAFESQDICVSDIPLIDNSPSEEQTDAYVLHLRKFFQRSERVSIEKANRFMQAKFSHDNPILSDWNKLYSCLIDMMKSSSLIGRVNIPELAGCCNADLEQIFKIKIYGDLFHLDKAKMKKLDEYTENPTKESMFRFEYISFLSECGEIINELASICERALGQPSCRT